MVEQRNLPSATERAKHQGDLEGGGTLPTMQPGKHTTADPAEETPVEARQGFLGRPVLLVLIASLVLAGLAWVIVDYAAR